MATAGQKRFASLDKDEMDEIMENLDAKNTKGHTHTAVKFPHSTIGLLKPTTLPSNIDLLSLSQSNITIEHDSGSAFGNSFELQALSSSQTETVFNDLLPDNDGVDDFLKSLDIPAQETCSNVPISKSMCQFPVPMITNCQNITINYNIFPRK